MIKDHLYLTMALLAHDNDMTLADFLKLVEKTFTVDRSEMPRNEQNEIVYPDGRVGISLESDESSLLKICEAADLTNVTLNQFVIMATQEALTKTRSTDN